MRRLLYGLLILFILAAGLLTYSMQQWGKPSALQEQSLIIAPGSGRMAILWQLRDAQLLPAPWKIILPFSMSPQLHKLKAGEYHFDAGMNPVQVLGVVASGKVVVHKVTVPEGFTVAQVRALLQKEPLLTGELPDTIPEGSLFPDTWLFQRGDTRASLITRMQRRMQQELANAWDSREEDLSLTSPEQVVTLASIVEAETAVPAERPLVARVYLNRLKIGMLLQSDPTVSYGLGGLGRALSYADLQKDTAYNTYLHGGLPPGPICNPGKAALMAATHPAVSDALYFVATGDGGHRFSASLKEHLANVAAYRRWQHTQASH